MARHVGGLFGPTVSDLALLLQLGVFLVARDFERAALGLQVLGADLDLGVLFDVVAQFFAQLDLLRQPRQTFGVKGVQRVEMLHRRLIEARQRDGFQFQTVLQQVLGRHLLHLLNKVRPLLMQFGHGQFGCDRAQGVDELTLDQFFQLFRMHGAQAQGLGRRGDGVSAGLNPHIELGQHVDAHPVLGDQRLLITALNRQTQGVHIDRNGLVQDRQDQGAAVHDDLLAAEAGADKGRFLGGALVQPRKDQPQDQQGDKPHARNDGDLDDRVHLNCP
ncbi:hypothetical protein D3C80_970530 [compost metagenome]